MKTISAIIIGAGNRGIRYAGHMAEMPEKYRVVAVADPSKANREHIQKMFDLPESACYAGWEEILAQPKLADVMIVATQDAMHREHAIRSMELGYDLLLEKHISTNP